MGRRGASAFPQRLRLQLTDSVILVTGFEELAGHCFARITVSALFCVFIRNDVSIECYKVQKIPPRCSSINVGIRRVVS